MGDIRFGIPRQLCERLHAGLALRTAVETGTFHGGSAAALREVFDRVWTIELCEQLHEEARAANARDGLEFLLGSSERVLPDLLAGIDEPALFWLDGHWSSGDTAGADRECPVLGELTAIRAWPHATESVVLIDDARFFLGPPIPPFRPEAWPTLREVLDAVPHHEDRYVAVLEDVIVAGPPAARPIVERYWLDRWAAFLAAAADTAAEPISPSPTPTPGAQRATRWARAAWRDLPPQDSLRRAVRHLRAAPDTIRRARDRRT